uniref:Uncharacterized protein n=1 Tax=Crocodylus porosus TaxID=8502 RepID=A0A7M4FKE8_CROPO
MGRSEIRGKGLWQLALPQHCKQSGSLLVSPGFCFFVTGNQIWRVLKSKGLPQTFPLDQEGFTGWLPTARPGECSYPTSSMNHPQLLTRSH